MKRTRKYVESCSLCDVHFESSNSYIKHCNTNNHKNRQLVTRNVAIMDAEEDLDNSSWIEPDTVHASCVPLAPPDLHHTDQISNQQVFFELDPTFFDNSQDNPEPPIDIGTGSSHEEESHSNMFYPFPDEKLFFILLLFTWYNETEGRRK